jgi:prepilin-type N-terminal cleavage/methylation domain-containing protein
VSALRSRRRPLPAGRAVGDAGITLVELLVAMMLFGIISAVVVGMFVSTTRATTQSRVLGSDTRSASNGLNEVARMIRAATENPVLNPAPSAPTVDPALAFADRESVTLFAYVNLDSSAQTPLKVRFWINTSRQLVETRWPATTLVNGHWNFSATALPDRILAGPIKAGAPVFVYLQGDGTEVVPPAAGLTDTDKLRTIKAVKIAMTVQTSGSRSNPVTVQNTVGMPNLGLTRTGTGTP